MNRIFFDMDGTLNNITKALLDDNGKVQIEKIYKNKGFYEKIEPENNMVETLRQLFEKTDYEIYIISACELGDPPGFEQQKNNWLDKNKIPVPLSNRIYVGFDEKKTDCIPGGIQDGDILIDDYNKNLEEWESEGISKGVKALGIKVCTDYNDTGKGLCGGEENKRWVGERVATKKSPEQNISAIENAINKLNSPEQYNMQAVDKSIYEIKYLKDCFGSHSYFGYKYGEQYTDGYDSKYELIEDNPEFKALLNKNKSDEFEQLYIDSISSVCLSIVAEIKISDDNTAAILKEYDEERPIYYLSDDYQIRGSTIEVNSKGNPINTLEEAEKALIDYSLKLDEKDKEKRANITYSNQDIKYNYDLYSEVFIDSNKYSVIDISDDIITIANSKFPLEQKKYKKEEFENKLKDTPLNQSLITQQKRTDINDTTKSFRNNSLPKKTSYKR